MYKSGGFNSETCLLGEEPYARAALGCGALQSVCSLLPPSALLVLRVGILVLNNLGINVSEPVGRGR